MFFFFFQAEDGIRGIVDLIYIAAGTLYLYDQTAWFPNEFAYPILLTTPCGFMDRFDAEGLIVYVKDTEDTHCDRLAQLIIHLITWCANNNWPLDDAWDAVQAISYAVFCLKKKTITYFCSHKYPCS